MKPRVAKALNAMVALGISREEARKTLKRLYYLYEKNWEFIEAENYRALVDAIFEDKGAEEKREANGESCMVNGKSSGHLKREFPESGSKKLRLTLQKDNVSLPLFLADKAKPCLIDLEDDSAGSDSSSEKKREYILPSTSCSNIKQDLGSAEDPMNQKESPSLALQSARNVENGSKPPPHHFIDDISKGMEKVKISLLDESGKGDIPRFFYIPQNIVYQNAHVSISLARISDDDSCPACSGDCLSSPVPCACARETSGEFAYNTSNGLLKEDFLNSCISLKRDPQKHHYVYCQECPLERVKNDTMPDPCKGHLLRRFVKECWSKCGCDMRCGNRVVQRGIAHSLQVFWTPEGKGWGLRSTEDLPKGAFVCEYVGEIMTNTELYERNLHNSSKRHTYPVNLDADWGSESILKDEEALCLDATVHGNVARFINHSWPFSQLKRCKPTKNYPGIMKLTLTIKIILSRPSSVAVEAISAGVEAVNPKEKGKLLRDISVLFCARQD